MTVGELRTALELHPPDMPVLVSGYEMGYDSLEDVVVLWVTPNSYAGCCGEFDVESLYHNEPTPGAFQAVILPR